MGYNAGEGLVGQSVPARRAADAVPLFAFIRRAVGSDCKSLSVSRQLYPGTVSRSPTRRLSQGGQYAWDRSHQTTFSLHECLPWRVRRLGPLRAEYMVLARIGESMAHCLQSVSKHHLQEILVFFDHVLHDPPALWRKGDNGGEEPPTTESCWRFLRGLSPKDWLRRYAGTLGTDRRIGFDLLQRQVRYLSRFYGTVLHPESKRYIPIPACHRLVRRGGGGSASTHKPRTVSHSANYDETLSSDDDNVGAGPSFGSSDGSVLSADDADIRNERRDLLDLLMDLRQRHCHPPVGAVTQAERVYAFQSERSRWTFLNSKYKIGVKIRSLRPINPLR